MKQLKLAYLSIMKQLKLAYLIPLSLYMYVQYVFYYNKYQYKLGKIENLIKKNKIYDFLNDINNYCKGGKDACLLSHNITEYAYNDIVKNGLQQYIDNIHKNPSVYETEDNEYVFIYQENPKKGEEGNMLNIYHYDKNLRNQYAKNTMPFLEEKCGKGRCNIQKILKEIKVMADGSKRGGFVEYYWYDPTTQVSIVKKSFVMKLSNIMYKGKKSNFYIGSGHSVRKAQQNIDMFKLNLTLINAILYIFMWYYFDVAKYLGNKRLNIFILTLTTVYISSFILDSYEEEYTIKMYEEHINSIMQTGYILTTFVSSIFIYMSLFKIKYDYILYKLLIVASAFTLFSSVYYTSNNIEPLNKIYIMKTISSRNATILLLLIFIFITLKRMNI